MDPLSGIGIGSAVGFLVIWVLRRLGFWSDRGVRAARFDLRLR
jgi:hypothetical protein